MKCVACNSDDLHCFALSGAGDERYRKYQCYKCGAFIDISIPCGDEDFKRMPRKGQKLAAIRLFRWASNHGLMEAKAYIDKLHADVLSEGEEDIE